MGVCFTLLLGTMTACGYGWRFADRKSGIALVVQKKSERVQCSWPDPDVL